MVSRLGSEASSQDCSDASAFEMTPAATAPAAQIISGEGKTMLAVTKRSIIAAAALAAAGLFGSLPFDGSSLADQGVPTVHRDVALVDTTSDIVGAETSLDDTLYGDAHTAATTLYGDAVTAYGVTDADALLGTTAADGATDIFGGAYASAGSGVFLDTWAAEDELNQLLGIPAATSQADILADIAKDPVVLPLGDSLPTAGTAAFDTDLMSLASGDFTSATTEFTAYLDGLSGLGDLGSLGDGLGSLGTDLQSLLDGLLGFL
jgi:hypothetical protein